MNQNYFRGNKHPFWRSRDDNHSAERDKLDNLNFLKLPSSKIALPPVIDDPALHKSIKGYRYATRNSKPTSHQVTNAPLQRDGVANIGKTVSRHL